MYECMYVCMYVRICMYLSACLPVHVPIWPSVYVSVSLPVCVVDTPGLYSLSHIDLATGLWGSGRFQGAGRRAASGLIINRYPQET